MIFLLFLLNEELKIPSWNKQTRYDADGKPLEASKIRKEGDKKIVDFTLDNMTLLRNPAQGNMIYEEGWAFDGTFNYTPERFWREVEDCKGQEWNNILYIRLLWGDLEKEEGQYAWNCDPGFMMYLEKAKQYGLKLAFRVFTHGMKAIPQYVKDKGAIMSNSYPAGDGKPQPNYDDPIFLECLNKFVKAFAERFDDPDICDFVDSYNTGHWGEGNGPTMRDGSNHPLIVDVITNIYSNHFKRVLTVSTLGDTNVAWMRPQAYEGRGFLQRRDGLGSGWFSQNERNHNNELFFNFRHPLIGESCYWFADGDGTTYTSYTGSGYKDFIDCFTQTMTDMFKSHSNTYDMRVPLQLQYYTKNCPNLIQRFISQGGYRLWPTQISYTQNGRKFNIEHTWQNYGSGILPNYHPNWDHKYQVTFSFIEKSTGAVKYNVTDDTAEPGDWYKDHKYTHSAEIEVPEEVAKGEYFLCVGITDKTKYNAPGIAIAVLDSIKIGEWVKIDQVNIE